VHTERERLAEALPGFVAELGRPASAAARHGLGAAVSGFVALAQQHRRAPRS